MTNRLALIFGGLILALLALDMVLLGASNTVFLGKKMLDVIHWMAFWR